MAKMQSPRRNQGAGDREISLLREHLDRKHLRLEKMIRASTRQAATATASALQHQLALMHKNLLVSLQTNGGLQDASCNSLPGSMPSPTLKHLDSLGSVDRFTTDPFSDFEEDPLSDDDEGAARLRFERTESQKRSNSDKDNLKKAWQEEDAEEEVAPNNAEDTAFRETLRHGEMEFFQKKRQMVARRKQLEENISPMRQFARRVVFDHRFEWLVSFIVVFNSLLVGIEAQWGIENLNQEPHWLLRLLDICCNVCFAVELLLRVIADRRFFISFLNPSLYWNLLDIFLVTFAWLEEIILLIASSEASVDALDVSVLRLLRMARLLRVARILRVVRFFSDLRVMVNGIKASSRALLWSIVLLSLVTYLFGVTFMQLSRAHLEETGTTNTTLLSYYGTLPRSVLTLFMTISGGILWKEALSPLSEIHWLLDLVFLLYIFCTVFCCLNVMTGIFVEAAQVTKKTDESVVQSELLKERKQWLADAAELFHVLDADNSGDVSKKEFYTQLYTERTQMLFRKLGIVADGYTPSELWDLLDITQSGAIVQADFAHAIRQIMGQGRAIDIYRLKKDMHIISRQVGDLSKTMLTTFGDADR